VPSPPQTFARGFDKKFVKNWFINVLSAREFHFFLCVHYSTVNVRPLVCTIRGRKLISSSSSSLSSLRRKIIVTKNSLKLNTQIPLLFRQ
jgi:hypothetical protein